MGWTGMGIAAYIHCLRLGRDLVALVLGALLVVGCGSDTLGDHAECADGSTREMSCGIFGNGTLTQVCTDFRWKDDGFCEDNNECVPGTIRSVACGLNGKGEIAEECTNGAWMVRESCVDPDVCKNGESREAICGVQDAGLQDEVCTNGQWAAVDACINELECELDAIDSRACGHNDRGVKERGCVDFMWEEDFGSCDDPDDCRDGTSQEIQCFGQIGVNGRPLVRYQDCVSGQWGEWGECVDADECLNGAEEFVDCGGDGLGLQARVCEQGRWNYEEHCSQKMSDILPTPYGLLLVNENAPSMALGSNAGLALGVEAFDDDFASLPMESAGPSPYRSEDTHRRFAASSTHQCAISSADQLYCWGDNSSGQLGPNGGSALETAAPVLVPLDETPEKVVVGEGFSCALTRTSTSGGRVYCWGRNDEGQSGRGVSLDSSPEPHLIQVGANNRFLAAGEAHTCVGSILGSVECWGRNTSHQVSPLTHPSFGLPTTYGALSSHPYGGLGARLLGLYAGANHTLALWTKIDPSQGPPDTVLVGVGSNGRGQLGALLSQDNASSPVVLSSVQKHLTDDRDFQVYANGDVTCVFEPQTNSLQCTGDNRFGQISDSNDEFIAGLVAAPADLSSFGEAIQSLAVQYDAICVLLSDSGRAACRGGNTYGQLGDGTTVSRPYSAFVLHPSSDVD